ncbi:MAG: MnmC family methyltransferase [Bdellovibrionota bacterium]
MDLKSFVIELTGDGSPTLRLKNSTSEKQPESMHHSGGAAAETLYIYTEPLNRVLSVFAQQDLSIGVVGLGLGYIELSILQSLPAAKLVSFEKEQELVDSFKSWINGQENKTYDLICEKLGVDKNLSLKKLKSLDWHLEGELNPATKISYPFNYVAYDAFSQFTDGPLWTDEFLDFFLTNLCAKDCVFATYACTGLLKRALIRNNFIFIKRPGFREKRDATLALRGEFISHLHLFQNA